MTVMRITRREVMALYNAIGNIKGRTEPVKDGDGKPSGQQYLKPYDMDLNTRYNLGLTRHAVETEAVLIDTQQQIEILAFAEKYKGRPETDDEKTIAELKLKIALASFMGAVVSVDIESIPMDGLKIATNQLDPDLISSLLPTIKEYQDKMKAKERSPETAKADGALTE